MTDDDGTKGETEDVTGVKGDVTGVTGDVTGVTHDDIGDWESLSEGNAESEVRVAAGVFDAEDVAIGVAAHGKVSYSFTFLIQKKKLDYIDVIKSNQVRVIFKINF